MSRTFKDQPYRVRAKRIGKRADPNKLFTPNTSPRISVIQLLFYAHEVYEKEYIFDWATENGYQIEVYEMIGFLAEGSRPQGARIPENMRHLEASHRTVMEYPVDDVNHIKWPNNEIMFQGRNYAQPKRRIWGEVLSMESSHIHTKENVFHTVTLFKETPYDPSRHARDDFEIPRYMRSHRYKYLKAEIAPMPDMHNMIKEINSNTDQYAPDELAEMIL